jgi:hypothetical protein
MAGVMIALAGAKGGTPPVVYPTVSMTAASMVGGAVVGHVRSGSDFATSIGESGGTLSATLLTGGNTDAIINGGLIFAGDRIAALVGVTNLLIDGTPHTLGTPTLNSGNTEVSIPSASFTAGETYSLQLA